MMNWLKKIAGIIAAASVALAFYFSARAKQAIAERDQAKQDADISKQVNEAHAQADKTAHKIAQKHRKETLNEKQQLAKNNRNQLDNNW
jgi:Na+-translocating ferredoxin:NAD+ oxidoreductase RnfG subunit